MRVLAVTDNQTKMIANLLESPEAPDVQKKRHEIFRLVKCMLEAKSSYDCFLIIPCSNDTGFKIVNSYLSYIIFKFESEGVLACAVSRTTQHLVPLICLGSESRKYYRNLGIADQQLRELRADFRFLHAEPEFEESESDKVIRAFENEHLDEIMSLLECNNMLDVLRLTCTCNDLMMEAQNNMELNTFRLLIQGSRTRWLFSLVFRYFRRLVV